MAYWSQSAFLQALGWATLNSLWQMALLWALYAGARHAFKLTSAQKYNLAVGGTTAGFLWFVCTFIFYFNSGAEGNFWSSQHALAPTSNTWNIVLTSASVAYLLLLTIPAYKLFKNWQYINFIKKQGLRKTTLENRLFVTRIAGLMGIKKKVQIYLSEFVTSPLTIGYIKPVILMPIAAVNNLTLQQLEAILLHELSHIKRFDYLVNFIIAFIHTLFYFNPFVKKFVAAIEAEREKCCDELVLQFGYDKVSYASALLTLEKTASFNPVFAIGATGKKHLLSRIEKIVGQEKKQKFNFNQAAGIIASLFLVLLINSLFFVSRQKDKSKFLADFAAFENPFYAFGNEGILEDAHSVEMQHAGHQETSLLVDATNKQSEKFAVTKHSEKQEEEMPPAPPVPLAEVDPNVLNVAFDETDAHLSTEQKQQIKQTIEVTKKVLRTQQWNEVEKAIADGMTAAEKQRAKVEYMEAIDKADWKNVEQKLKADYDNINWQKINGDLQKAMITMHMDSIQQSYEAAIAQLDMARSKAESGAAVNAMPLPDASLKELKAARQELVKKLDSLKTMLSKKVIKL